MEEKIVDAVKDMGRCLFKGKSSADVQKILNILSLTAMEQMLTRTEYTDVDFDNVAASITHSIEFYLRDFCDVAKDLIDADK